MNTRIAIISIILDNPKSVMPLNQLLHDSREYIIGRMGIPYKKNDINLANTVLNTGVEREAIMLVTSFF